MKHTLKAPLLICLYCGLNCDMKAQSHKIWGIDVTTKRVLIDSLQNNKFNKIDTLRFKFDAFSTYAKTYDSKNNRYLLECDTALLLFNANGTLYKTMHKPYDLEGLEYNPIDEMVYGMAFKTNSYYFAKLNLINGQLSLLKSISDNSVNSSTLDYENGYYYIISDSKGLFKIEISTGKKLDSTKIFTTNNCSCNEYDNETERINTICMVNAKKVMQVYNPSNKTFITIDTIEKYGTGYFGYNAACINQATGDWYFNLGKNIGVKNMRTNAKMDTLTTGFNRIRSIEYPGQACYNRLKNTSLIASSPLCNGGNDGSIRLRLQGGRPPYYHSLNNQASDTTAYFKNLKSGNYNLLSIDKNGLCQSTNSLQLIDVPAFKHTTNTKDNTCYGEQKGELSIATTGNTAPYQYSINNSAYSNTSTFNNLGAASYTIFIKDQNNCSDSISNIIIHAPSQLRIDSMIKTAINCHDGKDGSLAVFPIGGVAPYALQLDTTRMYDGIVLKNINTGRYHFKMNDANACVYEQDIEWLNPEPIELEVYTKSNTCGIQANAVAVLKLKSNANIGAYLLKNINTGNSYNLNDTIKTLAFGRHYFALETIKGCRDSIAFELKNNKGISLPKTLDTVLCNGQTYPINLSTKGATTYTTTADNGLTFNTPTYSTDKAGTYFITTTDSNACTYRDTFSIHKINTDVLHDFLIPSMALINDTVVAVLISQPKADGNQWLCEQNNATLKTQNDSYTKWQFNDTGRYTIFLKSKYGACQFETHKSIQILADNDSLKLERHLGYKGAMIQDFKVYSNPHDGQHFSIVIQLRDTASAKLYKIDGNGGQIISELDLGPIKTKTFTAFASIKSEVYYLKLVVGKESRVVKVVAVM